MYNNIYTVKVEWIQAYKKYMEILKKKKICINFDL